MIHVLDDPGAAVAAAALAFRASARAAIAKGGRFAVALTGGRIARPLYDAIAASEGIDWSRVAVYWGDERAVPPDHEDSNYRLAQALVDKGVRAYRMPGEAGDLEEAATRYAQRLPMALDLVHLGMGSDGHVCSLFPGHELLGDRRRRVAALTDSPKPPPRRITLTLVALHEARELHFIVTGAEKAEAVAAAQDLESTLPAAQAARGPARVSWFLDRAAASRMGEGS